MKRVWSLFLIAGVAQNAVAVIQNRPNWKPAEAPATLPQHKSPDPELPGSVRDWGAGEMAKVAGIALERANRRHCAQRGFPPPGLKCAEQASDILKEVFGDRVKTNSVKELYDNLIEMGWKKCTEPVEGAIALSNDDIAGMDVPTRSHTGVVIKSQGGYCIVHNSGRAGGCLVKTGRDGDHGCDTGDSGSGSYNKLWADNVSFLAPATMNCTETESARGRADSIII